MGGMAARMREPLSPELLRVEYVSYHHREVTEPAISFLTAPRNAFPPWPRSLSRSPAPPPLPLFHSRTKLPPFWIHSHPGAESYLPNVSISHLKDLIYIYTGAEQAYESVRRGWQRGLARGRGEHCGSCGGCLKILAGCLSSLDISPSRSLYISLFLIYRRYNIPRLFLLVYHHGYQVIYVPSLPNAPTSPPITKRNPIIPRAATWGVPSRLHSFVDMPQRFLLKQTEKRRVRLSRWRRRRRKEKEEWQYKFTKRLYSLFKGCPTNPSRF